MDKRVEQWFAQADYDLETAEYMLKGGRCFYAVFMAHLAVEKALKGVWQARLQTPPHKAHNLIYLVEKVGIRPPDDINTFLMTLNDVSVPTRYPDDLQKMMTDYPGPEVQRILESARKALTWIKAQR